MFQFIWVAGSCLLNLLDEWCWWVVLSTIQSCGHMSCRRSLSWLDGDASRHLLCFLRIVILVYFCSIEFHYITLLEINSVASAAVPLKPASSSWEKSAARWTTEEYLCWQFVGSPCSICISSHFCLDGASASPRFYLTEVVDETHEKCSSISIFQYAFRKEKIL